jgi:hypothetical protein
LRSSSTLWASGCAAIAMEKPPPVYVLGFS